MVGYIIAILFFVTLISFVFLRKERIMVGDNVMSEASAEAIGRLIDEYCRGSVIQQGGNGINPVFLMSSINKLNRMIGAKVRAGKIVSESEKWVYENYHLIYRYVYDRRDNLKSLPHIDGVPRIVGIAKIMVKYSLDGINEQKIDRVMEGLQNGCHLSYAEIREFENAISYAILEQIYILSKRLLKQEWYKTLAYRNKFNEKHLSSSVYSYYLFKINLLTKQERQILAKRGLDEKNVIVNYNNVVMKNGIMASTLITALREVSTFMPAQKAMKYLGAYKILKEVADIDNYALSTQKSYFAEIERIGLSKNVSEEYVAECLVCMAKANSMDISKILFDHGQALKKYIRTGKSVKIKNKNSTSKQILYAMSIVMPTIALSLVIGWFIDVILGFLSFVPLLFVVENILNYFLSYTAKEVETPKCNYKSVPYDHSLAIVISEYIASVSQFADSISHAEKIQAGNSGENVVTILLVDIKGGKEPFSDIDREIIDYLQSTDLPDGINVFIRRKELICGRYQAKERKRGAINAINKLFVTHNEEDFCYIYNNKYATPRYILALDADNELLPGEAIELVNMMAHPYNQDYDLLACHSRYDLYSLKTLYSLRFLTESGCEAYPTYSGLFYRLFRRDIYCGKGIYRLKNFFNKMEGTFPSDKILSHDALEGSIVVTGGGTTIFEEAPVGFLSDRERRKRWQRGDIQLLPFLFGRWKDDEGHLHKEKIEPIYRYIMSKNILGCLKETIVCAIILTGLFMGNNALIFGGIGLFLLPYLVNEIKILRGLASGILLRNILKNSVKNLLITVEDFFMLSYYSVSNLIILASTLFRMLRGKKLLEWKTYHSSQSMAKVYAFIKEFTPAYAVYTAIFALATVLTLNGIGLGIYLVISFFAYGELFWTSAKKLSKKKEMCKENREKLLTYAEKTYKYFKYMNPEGGIIADNFQVKPYKGIAPNTSPTNIGFAILSHICAEKLGFISAEECVYEMDKLIDDIKKLPKWKGNLYNWYDVKSQKPINNFVSSVDSGNFVASMIVAKEYCKEHGYKVEELNWELLIKNTDLRALFDESRNLFYLGFDGEKNCGHYDMFNSESRILSTIYVALYGNIEHFYSLQRNYIKYGGNTMLSWSGTMFETMMPELFFSPPEYSNMAQTVKNTVQIQKKNRINDIWGVSESGYYRFDDEMKYQYYAFGIGKMAMRNEPDKRVMSPYSSVLCLNYCPDDVIKNLDNIIRIGGYGEYGFFESIDMEGSLKIVSSFMTHHQGMILCAITNYLCNNKIKEYFQNNMKINSMLNLYNELPQMVRNGSNMLNNGNISTAYKEEYYKNIDNIEQYYGSFALSDGDYSLLINSFGAGFSKYKDIYINRYFGDYYDFEGAFFFVGDGKKWLSPTFFPLSRSLDNYSVYYSGKEIIFTNTADNISEKVIILNGLNGEVRKLVLPDEDDKRIVFYSSVCLNNIDAYCSHPTYNGLFTSAYIADNVLIIKKSSIKKDGKDHYYAIRVEGVKDLIWECNEQNFIGRNRNLSDPIILHRFSDIADDFFIDRDIESNNKASSLGDVLYPCIGFSGVVKEGSCQVIMMYGDDEKKLINTINSLPDDAYSFALYASDRMIISPVSNELLGEIMYRPYSHDQLNYIVNSAQRELFAEKSHWNKLLVYFFSETDTEGFYKFLTFAKDMNVLSIPLTYSIVIDKDLSKDGIDYITKHLREFSIKDYTITNKPDSVSDYAFIVLNSDMTYRKSKHILPDLFYKNISIDGMKHDYSLGVTQNGSLFLSGRGGFNEKDEYLCLDNTDLPYSNVIASKYGGMVATDNGGGFFYFGNSRENKMVRFDNDPVIDVPFERLYVGDGNQNMRINCKNNGYFLVDRGRSCYFAKNNDFLTNVDVSLICGGKGRVIKVDIDHLCGGYTEFLYAVKPQLNWRYDPSFITSERQKEVISYVNLRTNRVMYMKVIVDDLTNLTYYDGVEPYIEYYFEGGRKQIILIFSEDRELITSINKNNLDIYCEKEQEHFKNLSNIDVTTKYRSLNILLRYLPYQVYSSRLKGKLGYYQVGGATGFRDQLQDCLAFLHSDPELVKAQIISAARHQYQEGDVMHWWHEPALGLRTRITDDKLFLPLVVSEYVDFTEDYEILQEKAPFLSSPVLRDDEESRYEVGHWTEEKGSIYDHCLKAIKSALRYGEHGLLIMGSGDWNDGMDYISSQGKGESVFNSMLCYEVMVKFAPYCDEKTQKELLRLAKELKEAINNFAFEEDRYKRLYSDEGGWLGSERSDVLKLDILVQAYAVLSGVADGSRAEMVLDTARSLVDKNAGIIKLLTPPLDKNNYLGYISAYPKGVRENGGQYTHAAIWYLMALAKIGRQDEAYDLFRMINPVEKCAEKEKEQIYKGEPYVLSGDVYSNEDNYGQMGWSWYTGSAAWAYRFVIEVLFGIKRKGDKLLIEPHIPRALYGSVVTYRYKDSVYSLQYSDEEGANNSVSINEIKLEGGKRENILVRIGK